MPRPAVFRVPFLHLRIGKLNPFNIFRNHLNYTLNNIDSQYLPRHTRVILLPAAEGAPSFVCYLAIFTASLR